MFKLLGLDPETKHFDKWLRKLPDLTNKVVAITGTTSGCGFWSAAAAVKCNAQAVFLLNRSSKRSDESLAKLKEMKKLQKSSTNLIPVNCNLMSFASVEQAAQQVSKQCDSLGGLNIIAGNAGIMGFPDERTEDGFEVQMQVNYLSHYVLAKHLMPSLLQKYNNGEEVRVVFQSSAARFMRGGNLEEKYFESSKAGSLGGNSLNNCLLRYHFSKLAESAFNQGFAKEIEAKGYDINRFKSVGCEPGRSVTALGFNLLNGHKKTSFMNRMKLKVGSVFWLLTALSGKSQSPADGALCLIESMFGEDVCNGDFLMPEQRFVGIPYRVIAKGEVDSKAVTDETFTVNPKNQQMAMRYGEAICGKLLE